MNGIKSFQARFPAIIMVPALSPSWSPRVTEILHSRPPAGANINSTHTSTKPRSSDVVYSLWVKASNTTETRKQTLVCIKFSRILVSKPLAMALPDALAPKCAPHNENLPNRYGLHTHCTSWMHVTTYIRVECHQ